MLSLHSQKFLGFNTSLAGGFDIVIYIGLMITNPIASFLFVFYRPMLLFYLVQYVRHCWALAERHHRKFSWYNDYDYGASVVMVATVSSFCISVSVYCLFLYLVPWATTVWSVLGLRAALIDMVYMMTCVLPFTAVFVTLVRKFILAHVPYCIQYWATVPTICSVLVYKVYCLLQLVMFFQR